MDAMELDEGKIDDAVLALLRLTLHDERRAWKGFDWDALDRLHRKGQIGRPSPRSPTATAAVANPTAPSVGKNEGDAISSASPAPHAPGPSKSETITAATTVTPRSAKPRSRKRDGMGSPRTCVV